MGGADAPVGRMQRTLLSLLCLPMALIRRAAHQKCASAAIHHEGRWVMKHMAM